MKITRRHWRIQELRVVRDGGHAELIMLPHVEHGFGYGTETTAQQAALKAVMAFLTTLESISFRFPKTSC